MEQGHGNSGRSGSWARPWWPGDQAAAMAVGEVGGGQGEYMRKNKGEVSERGTESDMCVSFLFLF